MSLLDMPDTLGIRNRLAERDRMYGCPCGTGARYFGEGVRAQTRHARWHLQWDRGVSVPLTVGWFDSLAVVTSESTKPERSIAYDLGRLFQREQHYDFPMLPGPDTWKRGELHQALIAVHNQRAIGLLVVYPQTRWGEWDGSDGRVSLAVDSLEPLPGIAGIWVARGYRRMGVGTALVDALAQHADVPRSELLWSMPLSEDGQALAFSFQKTVRVS